MHFLLYIALLFLLLVTFCDEHEIKALQTSVLKLKEDIIIYGSSASDNGWGGLLPQKNVKQDPFLILRLPREYDEYGCKLSHNATIPASFPSRFVLYVPRGYCPFSTKALHVQQLGALGMILGDSIEAIYNSTIGISKSDLSLAMATSCENGKADAKDIVSPGWSLDNNLKSCHHASTCTSNRCMQTGKDNQVCCVWDVPDRMSNNGIHNVTIPIVRISAADAETLSRRLPTFATWYTRPVPKFEPSSFLLWILACGTAALASYVAAAPERHLLEQFSDGYHTNTDSENRMSLELNKRHVVIFVLVSSGFLLLIFYFPIVMVIIVLFALGS